CRGCAREFLALTPRRAPVVRGGPGGPGYRRRRLWIPHRGRGPGRVPARPPRRARRSDGGAALRVRSQFMTWCRRWMDQITGRAERDLDRELRAHLDLE